MLVPVPGRGRCAGVGGCESERWMACTHVYICDVWVCEYDVQCTVCTCSAVAGSSAVAVAVNKIADIIFRYGHIYTCIDI